MNVKNQKWAIENVMSVIVGIDIKTLQSLRKKNLIPRDCYKSCTRGKARISESYYYDEKKTEQIIERLRDEGIINKRRKRKKVRQ